MTAANELTTPNGPVIRQAEDGKHHPQLLHAEGGLAVMHVGGTGATITMAATAVDIDLGNDVNTGEDWVEADNSPWETPSTSTPPLVSSPATRTATTSPSSSATPPARPTRTSSCSSTRTATPTPSPTSTTCRWARTPMTSKSPSARSSRPSTVRPYRGQVRQHPRRREAQKPTETGLQQPRRARPRQLRLLGLPERLPRLNQSSSKERGRPHGRPLFCPQPTALG